MNLSRRSFLAAAGLSAAALHHAAAQTPAQSPAKPFRAAVIGDSKNGGYGHNLYLLWGLRKDIEVVALADPDDEGRAKFGAEAHAQRLYADYRQMLETEKPDLVIIGPRWPIHHLEYLQACAEHNCHGIMEKPLAVDLAEADAMIAAIEKRNLKWSLAFNFRASPVMQHARKLIGEQNLIGDLLEIRSRGKEDNRAGGEDLIVLGVHLFDLMNFFAGPPQWCSANIRMAGHTATPADIREATEPLGPIVGDHLQTTYGFSSGVYGYFSSLANRDGNQNRWGMELYGSKGVVTIRMSPVPDIWWLPDPSWSPGGKSVLWQRLPDAPQPDITVPNSHYKPIVDDLIDAIRADRRPLCSLHDGRIATEMIQAVWESHIQAKPVAIPLTSRDHPLKRWS